MGAAAVIPAIGLAFSMATTIYSMAQKPNQPKQPSQQVPQYTPPTYTPPTYNAPTYTTPNYQPTTGNAGPGPASSGSEFNAAATGTNAAPTPFTKDQLLTQRQDNFSMPTFLSTGAGMTPLQERIAIAAGGTNSSDPRYHDPETAKAYQQLMLNNYPTSINDIQPIERQYIKSLGQDPLDETPEGYLTALQNSIGAL